jgi:hypothetical protein
MIQLRLAATATAGRQTRLQGGAEQALLADELAGPRAPRLDRLEQVQ